MKKKRGSFNIFLVGIVGGIFGLGISYMGVRGFSLDFRSEWVIYGLLVILFLLACRIGVLWVRSKKRTDSGMDMDEVTYNREKHAYQFVGSTSLFLILKSSTLFLLLLGWDGQIMFFFPTYMILIGISMVLLMYGIFAQFAAVRFHNRYNPGTQINLNKTDGYKEYFEQLDEGEKFEQYRVAYKSFTSMNIAFPVAIFVLFCISVLSNPQFVAIMIVGILWFIMYMIYYREGYKIYK